MYPNIKERGVGLLGSLMTSWPFRYIKFNCGKLYVDTPSQERVERLFSKKWHRHIGYESRTMTSQSWIGHLHHRVNATIIYSSHDVLHNWVGLILRNPIIIGYVECYLMVLLLVILDFTPELNIYCVS